jgi:alkyldihydroxyacetonephosphate synthase
MVTPRGVFATRRLPASGAGPSPDRLVLGSEGTLGVVTEAWMRVRPRPKWRVSASVRFDGLLEGARAARAVAQSGLHPSNCRLLDPREARLNGVTGDGGAVLLLAFESAEGSMMPWMDRALALARTHGGTSAGPKERVDERGGDASAEAWRQAFVDAPYLQSVLVSLGVIADTFETACTWDRFEALHAAVTERVERLEVVSLGVIADTFETACTWDRFEALHAAVTERVERAMKDACGGGFLTCRFTHVYPDGPAPYFTFVAPGRAGEELAQWEVLKRVAGDALEASGATITHHHAVGRLHRPWYEREVPPLFVRALRAAKRELDPAGIMNPGVLFDP